MSTDALFSALGGGGLTAVLLALITWARSKGSDQANVAQRWESGVSTVLKSAQAQVERLDEELTKMRTTAAETRRELDDCQRQCRLLKGLLSETLVDLEHRGASTEDYRTRMRAI